MQLPSPETPPPPPANPLKWLWQCHQCSRIYALATTRRCLDDSHYFCAGTVSYKRDKKTAKRKAVKSRACASEFDYAGWKAWGEWRRNLSEERMEVLQAATGCQTDCARFCDYPSECRWGQQYGVAQTTAQAAVQPQVDFGAVESVNVASSTTFDDILSTPTVTTQDVEMTDAVPTPPSASTINDKKPSLDDLLSSVKRRKRLSAGGAPPSPLAAALAVEDGKTTNEKSARALQKAFDDFELDLRKGLGKASGFVASAVLARLK
jgi:hypothetical protein